MAVATQYKDLAAGVVLGDTYELVQMIGEGGMGQVWVANHLRLPKQIAVKFLHGAMTKHAEANVRFRREAEICARLHHPTIVEILDYNVLSDGTPYLVMEYLQGEALRDKLLRGPLTLEDVVPIAAQISDALSIAHKHGVVHRDLKPENVFLCADQLGGGVTRVKVLDFGISKMRDGGTALTQTSSLLGTPQYMAPEQARGAHDKIDGRTDQFALAAMVYEMLVGKPAFPGQSLPEVIHRVVYEASPALPGNFPNHVVEAVRTGLSKEPGERFDTISIFSGVLAGGGLPTRPSPEAKPQSAQPQAKIDSFAKTALTDTGSPIRAELATPAPSLVAGHRRRVWLVPLLALVAIAGVAIAFAVISKGDKTGGEDARAETSAAVPTEEKPEETIIDPVVKKAETPPEDPLPEPIIADEEDKIRRPNRRSTEERAPVDEKQELANDLLEPVYMMIAEGEFADAERLARIALQETKAPAVYAALTIIACKKGDQVNAFAHFKKVRPRALKRRVLRQCPGLR